MDLMVHQENKEHPVPLVDLVLLVLMEKKGFQDKRVKRVMLGYLALQGLKVSAEKEEALVHQVFLDKKVKRESPLL